jgi:asparagine N-glycosylation enzyme membrane subunit Stt3
MIQKQKPSTARGEMAFIFAIVLGLMLGIAIKRVRVGLLIGVALGLLIVFTGALRSSKR